MKLLLVMSSIWLLTASCKLSTGSDVDAVTGIDELGRKAALSIVSVRNHTATPASTKTTDPGVLRADALIRMPFFAMVQCVTEGGLEAQKAISVIEHLSATNNLFLNANRELVSFNPQKDNRLTVNPCQVVGGRLLSWMVIADVFQRAAGLPKDKPTNATMLSASADSYALAQAVYLSIRGSTGDKQSGSAMLSRLAQMADAHEGFEPDRLESIQKRFSAGDANYNPCDKTTPAWFASEWKHKNFACVKSTFDDTLYNYAAGGAGGKNYRKFRDTLAIEIAATHEELYLRLGSMLPEDHLWDVLTSTESWFNQSGPSKNLGRYLAGDKSALNFDSYFGKQSGAGFGLADSVELSVDAAVKLAFGHGPSRKKPKSSGFALAETEKPDASEWVTEAFSKRSPEAHNGATVQGRDWLSSVETGPASKIAADAVTKSPALGTFTTAFIAAANSGQEKTIAISSAGLPSLNSPQTFQSRSDPDLVESIVRHNGLEYGQQQKTGVDLPGQGYTQGPDHFGSAVWRDANGNVVFVPSQDKLKKAVDLKYVSADEAAKGTTSWERQEELKTIDGVTYRQSDHTGIPGLGSFRESQLIPADPNEPRKMEYEFKTRNGSRTAVVDMLDTNVTNGYAVPDPSQSTSITNAFVNAQKTNYAAIQNSQGIADIEAEAALNTAPSDGTYFSAMNDWFTRAQASEFASRLHQNSNESRRIFEENLAGAGSSRSRALRDIAAEVESQYIRNTPMIDQINRSVDQKITNANVQLASEAFHGTVAATSDAYGWLRSSAAAWVSPSATPAGNNPAQQQSPQAVDAAYPGNNTYPLPTVGTTNPGNNDYQPDAYPRDVDYPQQQPQQQQQQNQVAREYPLPQPPAGQATVVSSGDGAKPTQ